MPRTRYFYFCSLPWALARTLKAAISMEALKMAIDQAVAMCSSEILKGLVHHSDRGVQYCCDAYVAMLKAHEISISMESRGRFL